MKKIISILLLVCTLFTFTACTPNAGLSKDEVNEKLDAVQRAVFDQSYYSTPTPKELTLEEINEFKQKCNYYDNVDSIIKNYDSLIGNYIKVDALVLNCNKNTKDSSRYNIALNPVPTFNNYNDFTWCGIYYSNHDLEFKYGDQVIIYGIIIEKQTFNSKNIKDNTTEKIIMPCIEIKCIENYNDDGGARYQFVKTCEKIDYNSIMRNPSNYMHKNILVDGIVIQVTYYKNQTDLRIMDENYNVWYVHYLYKDGESHFLEKDLVCVYGVCGGTTSYTSTEGKQITIPCIMAKYLEIVDK